MEVFRTRILQLNMCVILLTYLDYSKSSPESKIKQHISKTVFVGETVTLCCNKSTLDDDLTWRLNNSVIFRQFSVMNRTHTNFSSNRIHIDPAAPRELKIQQIQASDAGNYTCYPAEIRWTLTITEERTEQEESQQSAYIIIPILLIIIASSGVPIACLIITIYICKHRRCKNKTESQQQSQGETAPSRGRIQTQRSQYFERYNSVYGQI